MKNKIYVCVLLLFIIASGYLLSFLCFSEVVILDNPVITFKHDYGYEYLDSTQATLYDKLSKRDMELNEIYLLDQEYDYDYIQKVLELYRTNNWDLCNDYCYGAIQEPTEMWNYGPLPVSKIKAVRVSYPIENYEEKVKQREELANEVLSKIPENTSDIEKIRYIHDYLIDHITYDGNVLTGTSSSFTSLLEGRALCEGYAGAFEYLAKKLGFDAIKISGKVGINKEDHAWNMVKINDNWYHIDCTWDDDPSNRYTYFLLSDEELNFLRYNKIREYSQDIPVPKAESSLWNK